MRIGINAGFGQQIGDDLRLLEELGFQVVRQEIHPTADVNRVRTLVAEFAQTPLIPLFLLAGGHIDWPDRPGRVEPHEIAEIGVAVVTAASDLALDDFALEVGNEPDLAHAGYSARPLDFAEAVRQTRDRVRDLGFSGLLISGGVSNLNTRGLDYLTEMLQWERFPDDVAIGFHRYPETWGYHDAPHRGFTSRQDEVERLRGIVGTRRIACTEFGYHTAPETRLIFRRRRTDDRVAESVMFDFDFWREQGCELAVLYQLNDGPDANEALDCYGIRSKNGLKPVAEAIRTRFGPAA